MGILRVLGLLLVFAFSALSTVQAQAEVIAGTVARLVGDAKAIGMAGARTLAEGDDIWLDDAVETGADARLLIRFADQSTLTLGENALVIVDDMVLADSDPTAKQTLDMVRGVFSYISGNISKTSKDRVQIRTPVATIGIRGTEFVGGELTVGMAPGRPHYGFQIRDGAIAIMAPGGTVTLDEPGQGTFLPLTRVAAPTPVRQWTPEEAAEADAALAFPPR